MTLNLKVNVPELSTLRRALGNITTDKILDAGLMAAALKLRTLVEGRSPEYVPQKWEREARTRARRADKKAGHAVRPKIEVGKLKRSWSKPAKTGPLLYSFKTSVPYARILEEGLYPKEMVVTTRKDGTPGRLHFFQGGVYSKQAPGGIVGPILQDTTRRKQLADLIAQQMVANIRKFLK